jgi:hypothetical protein
MESDKVAANQETRTAPDHRVRGVGPKFVAVITEAATRSLTFRGLVEKISNTDGIVYIAQGQCGHGVRACLLNTITMAGPNRVLRILVNPRKTEPETMTAIGHELQHAAEVLSDRTIRDTGAMVLFFRQMCAGCLFRFETDAAIAAGMAVRGEVEADLATERRRSVPHQNEVTVRPSARR